VRISLRTFRIARDAISAILLRRIDDAIQPMDARLAANEMTEAVFDALDPSADWRNRFAGDIAEVGLD
jgi:hypothetical protein